MWEGLCAKFRDNPYLQEKLLNTKTMKLAEASRTDKYWGIGFAYVDSDKWDETRWGKNMLGKLLMILRLKYQIDANDGTTILTVFDVNRCLEDLGLPRFPVCVNC